MYVYYYLIRLVTGFVTIAKDNVNIPIDSCSIELKEFEKLSPPDSHEFDFVASKCGSVDNDNFR